MLDAGVHKACIPEWVDRRGLWVQRASDRFGRTKETGVLTNWMLPTYHIALQWHCASWCTHPGPGRVLRRPPGFDKACQ